MALIYILLGCCAAILVLKLVTNKFRNPYKLYLVFGKKGSGKSTYLVKTAKKYLDKGYIVYSNMDDCMLPGMRLFDVNHLGDFVPCGNSLLLVDEVGMIWDNRDFKKFKPSLRDFFKLQRHYHVVCYLASQTFDVDKKIRDLTDGMILFVNVLNVFSVGKTITRKVVLTESTSDAESRISENLAFTPIWNWKFTYIPKWSKYFDSFKIPDTPELPYTEIEADPEEILKQTYSKKNFYKRLLRNPKWLLVYAWYALNKITEWKIWGDIFDPPEVNPFYKL